MPIPIPAKKEPVIDVEGSDIVSTALITLLNTFPGLGRKKVTFSTLAETSGIGFFPTSGAVLLGRWLERQPVTLKDVEYVLSAYPNLEKGRKIKSIVRSTPAFLERAYEDGVEDWTIRLTLNYEADYYK